MAGAGEPNEPTEGYVLDLFSYGVLDYARGNRIDVSSKPTKGAYLKPDPGETVRFAEAYESGAKIWVIVGETRARLTDYVIANLSSPETPRWTVLTQGEWEDKKGTLAPRRPDVGESISDPSRPIPSVDQGGIIVDM